MRRSDAIDGIRGLAALSVLVFHVWLYRDARPPEARWSVLDELAFALHLGLICFFVLSGFLLYRAFARAALGGSGPVDRRTYAVRRAARIVPAYYACLAGCLALYALVGLDNIVPAAAELPAFALFAQNYSTATLMQLNPVTWTLVVEAAFYVVLPLVGALALLAGPRRPRAQLALLAALVAVTVAWNHAVAAGDLGEIARKALPAWLGVFATGMFAAHWLERRRRSGARDLTPRRTLGLALLGAAIAFAVAGWHQGTTLALGGWRTALGDVPTGVGFALLIAAVASGTGVTVRALAWRPLAFLGLVSYGLYLWHLPLILVLRQAGLLPEPLAPRLLVVLALSTLLAWLSWRLLEEPAIRWSHRRVGRRPAARPVPRPVPEPARSRA